MLNYFINCTSFTIKAGQTSSKNTNNETQKQQSTIYTLKSQIYNYELQIEKPKIFRLKNKTNNTEIRCVHFQRLHYYFPNTREILNKFNNLKGCLILPINQISVIEEIKINNNDKLQNNVLLFFFETSYIYKDLIIINKSIKYLFNNTDKLFTLNCLSESKNDFKRYFPLFSDKISCINFNILVVIDKNLIRYEEDVSKEHFSITEKYYGDQTYKCINLFDSFIVVKNLMYDIKSILIENNSFLNKVYCFKRPGSEIVYKLINNDLDVMSFFENSVIKIKNNIVGIEDVNIFNSNLNKFIKEQIILMNKNIDDHFNQIEIYSDEKREYYNNMGFSQKD